MFDQTKFEELYHGKLLRYDNGTFSIEGICTAALLGEETTILAIMAKDYELGKTPEKWITFSCPSTEPELSNWLHAFTIIINPI